MSSSVLYPVSLRIHNNGATRAIPAKAGIQKVADCKVMQGTLLWPQFCLFQLVC